MPEFLSFWVPIIAGLIAIVAAIVAIMKWGRHPIRGIVHWVKARTLDRLTDRIQAPRRKIALLESRVADLESKVAKQEDPLAERQERLHRLTQAEQEVLRPYVSEATRTQYLDLMDGVVAGLEHELVIYRPVAFFQLGLPCAFNMQPWAYDYLIERPHLVGLPTRSDSRATCKKLRQA